MAVFESKPKRLLKKIRKLAQDDMVDQAAVMIEDEMDTLMEERDVARGLLAFLMDIGHPDLAARLSDRIIKSHPELRGPIKKLLEDRHLQFTRSFELLRAIWTLKLRQREFSGMIELLNRVDRMTEARMIEVLENAVISAEKYSGDGGVGTDIDRFLGWSVALYRKSRITEAMDVLLSVARKSRYPNEALAQLSAWIVSRGGGKDPVLYLSRIRIHIAMGNFDKALLELPNIFEADEAVIDEAISIVEKEIIPVDDSHAAHIALARLLSSVNRPDDSCRVIETLLEKGETSDECERTVSQLASSYRNLARPLLLLARIRRIRGEHTGGFDAMEKAFESDDIDNSPVVQVCREFLAENLDRENMIARFLSSYLIDKGSVTDAIEILSKLAVDMPDWVTNQVQKLLARDRESAAILTLMAVVMLVKDRKSEAKATLDHLSARTDLRSRQDILQVLDRFDSLMGDHPELRRVRAAAKYGAGSTEESAVDWFELLLTGEKVPEHGLEEILAANLPEERAEGLLASSFSPVTPLEAIISGIAALSQADIPQTNRFFELACSHRPVAGMVADKVRKLPADTLKQLDLEKMLPLFNAAGRGRIAAKIMDITRDDADEQWRTTLVHRLSWDNPSEELFFRLDTLISMGNIGLAGSAADGLQVDDPDLKNLTEGCRLVTSGKFSAALEPLTTAASSKRTATLASKILEKLLEESPGPEVRIALAETCSRDDRFDESVRWLQPVLTEPAVLAFLESAVQDKHGIVPLMDAYIRALASTERFDDFRTQVTGLLDISTDNAGDYAALSLDMGNRYEEPEALIFAAMLSDRYDLGLDSNEILCRTIELKPVVAKRFTGRAGNSPSLQILCSLAERNAEEYAALSKRHSDSPVSVSEEMIRTASAEWKPEVDAEALFLLAQLAASSRYRSLANDVRKRIASHGQEPWRRHSADKLYEEFIDGNIESSDFWAGIRVPELLEKVLERTMNDVDLAALPGAEIDQIVSALTESGISEELIAGFGLKLIDSGRDDLSTKMKSLALHCYNHISSDTPEKNIVRLLLAGELFREASELALTSNDNELLSAVSKGLRNDRSNPEGSPAFRAKSFLQNMQADLAVSELAKVEEELSVTELDILAHSSWKLGRRDTAARLWLKCFRDSGDTRFLARLEWVLDTSGSGADRNAVRRFLAEHHPELNISPVSVDRNLDLISML